MVGLLLWVLAALIVGTWLAHTRVDNDTFAMRLLAYTTACMLLWPLILLGMYNGMGQDPYRDSTWEEKHIDLYE